MSYGLWQSHLRLGTHLTRWHRKQNVKRWMWILLRPNSDESSHLVYEGQNPLKLLYSIMILNTIKKNDHQALRPSNHALPYTCDPLKVNYKKKSLQSNKKIKRWERKSKLNWYEWHIKDWGPTRKIKKWQSSLGRKI